uniref:Uncharacterized protein n=1 Tax=Glossina brevipalpis TaxID=37001 RepID=A0A1A9WUA9_9MUSC
MKTCHDLPSDFKSPYCHSEEHICHLIPFKRSCLMTQYEELIELQELLIRFKKATKILSKPQTDSESKNLKNSNISLETCFPKVENLLEMKNLKNIVLSEIIIKILHNFTHISGSIIQMWYKQIKIDENDKQTTAFWINMEVDF